MKTRTALVVGGGIGGLAVACALADRGVAVTLVEQARQFAEIGAGLQLSPNGLAVVRALGLDDKMRDSGAVRGRAVVLADHAEGRQVARLDLMRLGSDQQYYFMHRADLIDVLRRHAQALGVVTRLGHRVARIIPGDRPEIRLEDGGSQTADMVIAADGLHSVARAVLNGDDRASFTGQVAWRALIPNDIDHPAEARVTMGPGRHLVSYPLRRANLINLVAVEERDAWAAEGWNHKDDPAHLRAAFAAFGGDAHKMIGAVQDVALWGLHRHPVAENWGKSGVALLGDAAHPTLPFLAQGANMALEDAWVLARCLADLPRDAAVQAYQAQRQARVRRVIRAAEGNAWRYHLRPGPLRTAAHLGLRTASRVAPGRMIGAFDWLYRHDVTDTGRQ